MELAARSCRKCPQLRNVDGAHQDLGSFLAALGSTAVFSVLHSSEDQGGLVPLCLESALLAWKGGGRDVPIINY